MKKPWCFIRKDSEDDVTLECRRYSISMLVQAMKPSLEQDDYLFTYAKAIEKTMYNMASKKQPYFHLISDQNVA